MYWVKQHISVTLFFLVVTVGFVLSPAIGPAWDEPDNMFSGGVYVNFFQHGLDPSYFALKTDKASIYGDRIFPNDHLAAHLPPIHNYVGVLLVLAAQALHIPTTAPVIIIAWHMATVLFFAVTVTMTYRFGLLLGLSVGSSLFASLAVFMFPQLFGHGLSNVKDTAQAAMFILALYYLVKKDLLIGAVVWGVGLATKFNAVYVPIIWGIWRFAMVIRDKRKVISKNLIHITYHVLLITAIGVLVAVAVWPYLWFDTIQHILEVVRYFITVGQGYRVVWNGIWYTVGVGKSLWWYPLGSFVYTTPLPLLGLIFFGSIILVRKLTQKPAWAILPIWILIPLIRTLSPWSAFYDLMRHFLEIIPALVLVAAIGLEWFFQKKHRFPTTGVMLGAIILGQMIYINVSLFPYSTGYYNVLAQNPNTNFDRDIEALSVKEAVDYIHQRYGDVRMFSSIGGHLSWYYLTPGDRYMYTEQGADTVIVVNKASHIQIADYVPRFLTGYTMVHEIRRGDAIFAWIYRRNK